MIISNYPGNQQWALWQKILFRFFFIYFLLHIAPWTWINYIPGGYYITQYYYQLQDWSVTVSNNIFFHVREVLVPINGSGDTSYGWAQVWLYLSLAIAGTLVWSLFGNSNQHYNGLSYWLRTFLRYFLIINCISYGLYKVFLVQMTFPNTSQLATPLGDFLPMRLAWLYMGSSDLYEFFCGLLEITAGVLLLFRRTTTLGLFFASGVFLNVLMMNLGYDIPVKIFSAHLFLMSLFLLSFETRRIISFFILNQPTPATDLYKVHFEKKWMRIGRIILKLTFILLVIVLPFNDIIGFAKQMHTVTSDKIIPNGVYEVNSYVRNNDTISPMENDSVRWQDVIIDNAGQGSIKTNDTLFRTRYGRGYFNFSVHEKLNVVDFSKRTIAGDSIFLFKMHYSLSDSNSIYLKGLIKSDSVFVSLKKTKRHFPLAEKQFHWLSEYNR